MASKAFIGSGAGFAGDRADAAGPVVAALAQCHGFRCIMFEMLAERTLALAQSDRLADPSRGYIPAFEPMLTPILRQCLRDEIKIVGNFGAANPPAAAQRILSIATTQGLPPPRIAVIEGDDLSGLLSQEELADREADGNHIRSAARLVSANLYLGAAPIAEALDRGADIVVTGRIADSALALGPLMHAFRWKLDDWDHLAAGTLAGHLLECGSQITGGYFADPPFKEVPGMANIGYPISEIDADGGMTITKPPGTGGRVDRLTVTEQLLYEIHDPAAYLAPDVTLDVTDITLEEIAPDRVRVVGARGKPAPEMLKATVCVEGGLFGVAEISYAGRNAAARARLAAETVRARMKQLAPRLPFRVDAIGVASVLASDDGAPTTTWPSDATDVRLRFATQSNERASVQQLLNEVEALYCAGPAGGAGVQRHMFPRLTSASCLLERTFAQPRITMVGGQR